MNKNKRSLREGFPSPRQESEKRHAEPGEENQQQLDPVKHQGGHSRRTDAETNTSGYGSAQRGRRSNVGPLDADLQQLPSEKRRSRGGNTTGPGIG